MGSPGISRLNVLTASEFESAIGACCASARFCKTMFAARPFRDISNLLDSARNVWRELDDNERLVAFAAHPRIGESITLQLSADRSEERFARWSHSEQGGVDRTQRDTMLDWKLANDNYFNKFGFVFLVCASGKTSGELLEFLERRLMNDYRAELAVAGVEQEKITVLRLLKLLEDLESE
jgi:2-oxo-4-hydroxy-4-carboxy-5-ureidoimidazoline decarboxylase